MYHNKSDRRRTAASIRAALPDMDKDMLAARPPISWTLCTTPTLRRRQFHFTDE